MYLPTAFEETRTDRLRELIHQQPLATLVIAGHDGLIANLIPLRWCADGGAHGSLRGHIARANPLAAQAAQTPAALAVFHGVQTYISPSWYPGKLEHGRVVPTWNYTTVQAHGRLRFIDDPVWLRAELGALSQQQEAAMPQPWTIDDAPAEFIARMLGAVVGIELSIDRLTGKFKLSQNQPAANRDGVIAGLRQRNGTDDAEVAARIADAARALIEP